MQQINTPMDKNVKAATTPAQAQVKPGGTRDGFGLHFSSHLKITDPKTGAVILQQRCS